MAFFDAWESNQLRRSARLAFNDAAEPDEMEPDAKRQKTSTIDLEAEYNLIPVYSDTADTPLSDLELQPVKREVTVIKQEDWVFTDGNDILDEIQDVENVRSSNDIETLSNHTDRLSTTEVLEENVQPSNNNETLSNHTGTLSTMEALELAERVEWMKLHDDGSLLSDRRLLEDLGQNFRTWSARYRP